MKKTLVAVAALAAFGSSAFAQSSVTLYGKIDWTLRNVTTTAGGVKTGAVAAGGIASSVPGAAASAAITTTGNKGLAFDSAGLSGTRWGMKGVEDLGGGLSAVFQLEEGFTIDDGGATANLTGAANFGRQAYAGLKGGFGQIAVGRQYTPLDTQWCTYEVSGCATPAALGFAWANSVAYSVSAAGVTTGTQVGFHADKARQNNSILYMTPDMGGFNAQVMYAPSENKNPRTGQSAGQFWSASVGYLNGPLGVGLVYESEKYTAGGAVSLTPTGAASATMTNWTLSAQYDFGVAKLMGGFERSGLTGGFDENGWMLGAAIPVGPASVLLSYARESVDMNTAVDGRKTAFSAIVVYPLSKRTNVYADFRQGRARAAGAVTLATTKENHYGVGMRHDF